MAAMEYHVPLEITLVSAEGVLVDDDVGFPSPHMEFFAVVTLVAGDAVFAMQRTPTVAAGSAEDQRSPAWNFAVRFSVPRGGCDCQKLRVDIWRRCSHGDHGMMIGKVEVPLAELLQGYYSSPSPPGPCFLSRYITTPCGGAARGVLTFTSEVVEKEASRRALDPVPLLEWLPSQPFPAPSSLPQESPAGDERNGAGEDQPMSEPAHQPHRHGPVCSLLRWWWVWLPMVFAGWGLVREMILALAAEIAYERIQRGCGNHPQTMVVVYGGPPRQPPPPPPPPPSPATLLGLVVFACLLAVATRAVRDRLRI